MIVAFIIICLFQKFCVVDVYFALDCICIALYFVFGVVVVVVVVAVVAVAVVAVVFCLTFLQLSHA
jgi:hypothetical protein